MSDLTGSGNAVNGTAEKTLAIAGNRTYVLIQKTVRERLHFIHLRRSSDVFSALSIRGENGTCRQTTFSMLISVRAPLLMLMTTADR